MTYEDTCDPPPSRRRRRKSGPGGLLASKLGGRRGWGEYGHPVGLYGVIPVGDLNGDGFDDMVAAEPEGDGHRISMLFGGPDMDALADASFHHAGGVNCWSNGWMWPTNCVSSAGDLDHDGLDDIAVVDYTVVHPDDVAPFDDPMGQVWIYTNVVEGGPTLIGDPGEDAPPSPARERMELSVHPNPFNPRATIEWVAPREGRVSLRVFTLRGEFVAELLDEVVDIGPGSVVWNGQDLAGRQVASGAYVAELRGFGKAVSKKLALVR